MCSFSDLINLNNNKEKAGSKRDFKLLLLRSVKGDVHTMMATFEG